MLETHYGLSMITTSAISEIVTTSALREYLRIASTETAEDETIMALQTVVRKRLESRWGRSFVKKTYSLYLDAFPASSTGAIVLPISPAGTSTGAVSIVTYDTDDSGTTWSSTEYQVDSISEPPRITVKDDYDWPDDLRSYQGVAITFVAGYSSAVADVPEGIAEAVKAGVAVLYEHRGDDRREFVGVPTIDLDNVLALWDSEFDLSEAG